MTEMLRTFALALLMAAASAAPAKTVTKTLNPGGGADYTNLTDWHTDLATECTASCGAGDYESGDDAVLNIIGAVSMTAPITISNGSFLASITIQGDASDRHDGTPGSGARLVISGTPSSGGGVLELDTDTNFVIQWLEINGSGQNIDGCFGATNHTSTTVHYLYNLCHNFAGNNVRNPISVAGRCQFTTQCFIIRNAAWNMSVGGSNTMQVIDCQSNQNIDCYIAGNVVHNITHTGTGLIRGFGTHSTLSGDREMYNNVVGTMNPGSGSAEDYNGSVTTESHNATTFTSGSSGISGTGSVYEINPATVWNDPSNGDFHLAAASGALYQAGIDLSGGGVGWETDIDGESAGSTPDIGIDEFIAGGPSASVPVILMSIGSM